MSSWATRGNGRKRDAYRLKGNDGCEDAAKLVKKGDQYQDLKFGSPKSKLRVGHRKRRGDDDVDTWSTDYPGKMRKALRRARLWKSKAVEVESNATEVEYRSLTWRRCLDTGAVRKYVKDGVKKRLCIDRHNKKHCGRWGHLRCKLSKTSDRGKKTTQQRDH